MNKPHTPIEEEVVSINKNLDMLGDTVCHLFDRLEAVLSEHEGEEQLCPKENNNAGTSEHFLDLQKIDNRVYCLNDRLRYLLGIIEL